MLRRAHRGLLTAAGSAWLALACAPDRLRATDVPADVAWIAMLVEDTDGRVLSATALRPYSPEADAALTFRPGADDAVVELVGFTRAQLPGPDRPDFTADLLEPATGCAPTLPAPRWRTRLGLDGPLPLALEAVPTPPITARWLESQCPHLTGPLAVESNCVPSSCSGSVTQVLCAVTIDLTSCGLGTYSGRIDADGRFCGKPLQAPDCAVGPATNEAMMHVSCADNPTCEVNVHGISTPPALTLDRLELFPGTTPRPPPNLAALRTLRTWHRFTGRLGDLAPIGDLRGEPGPKVAVVARTGEPQSERVCSSSAPTELVIVDRATLEVEAHAPAPACLARLATADEGLFGLVEAPSGPWLARFDAHGVLTSSAALPMMVPPGRIIFGAGLTLGTPEGLIAAVSWSDPPDARGHSVMGVVVFAADPATLVARVLFEDGGDQANIMVRTGDGRLALTFDDLDEVRRFDATTGAVLDVSRLASPSSASFGYLTAFVGTGSLTLTVPNQDPMIYDVTADRLVARGHPFYAPRRAPLVATPWPPGQRGLILGLGPRDVMAPFEAAVALYDAWGRVLPGVTVVGYGAVTGATTVGDEAWLSLGWEGTLVRARAAEAP